MQSLAAFTESFLNFERDENLFAIDLKGHAYWAYLRYAVFYEILNKELEFVPRRSSAWKRSIDLLRAVPLCTGGIFGKRTAYDVLLLNYHRSKPVDGKYVNIHTYLISKCLSRKYKVAVLDFYNWNVGREGYVCDAFSLRHRYLYVRAKSLILPYTSDEQEVVDEIGAKLKRAFGVEIDLRRLTRSVYSFQILLYQEFRKVLEVYNPKLIGYCNTANLQGVTEAARDAGVPTVDFQHSLISYLNILYNYPQEHVKEPPSVGSDFIFSFGSFWTPEFRLSTTVLPTGFPYFDLESQRFLGKSYPNREQKIILIADEYARLDLAHLAIELATLLPAHQVYYKLRPEEYGDWRQRYPRQMSEINNLVVVDHDRVPLYEYFAMCSYQIGTNSTALYEGIPFGLTTFVLRAGWYEELRTLYEGGYAFLVDDAREIVDMIEGGLRPSRTLSRESIFRERSLDRIEDLVDEIIAGRTTRATVER